MSKYNEVMENVRVTDEMRQRILTNIAKEVSVTNESQVTQFENYKKSKENKVVRFITRYGSMVAIFALVVAGSYAVIRTVGLNGSKGEMAATTAEEATDYAYVEEATETAEATESTDGFAEIEESAAEDDAVSVMPDTSFFAGKSENSGDSVPESETNGIMCEEVASADELSEKLGFEFKDSETLKDKAISSSYYIYDDGGEILYITSDDTISYFASSKGSFIGERNVDITAFSENKTVDEVELYGDDGLYKLACWKNSGISYSIVSKKGIPEEELLTIIEK